MTTPEGPFLELGGDRFACLPSLPGWQLLKFAKASRLTADGDFSAGMIALYDFVQAILLPAELTRFEQSVGVAEVTYEDIDAAVGMLIGEYAARPTVRRSSSPGGPPDMKASSTDGSPSPDTPRRTVSLSSRSGLRDVS